MGRECGPRLIFYHPTKSCLNGGSRLKIAMMGSWNTDGGVCRHTTPVIEWLRSEGFEVSVLTHYSRKPRSEYRF